MDTEHVFMPEVRRLLAKGQMRRAIAKLDEIYAARNQGELFRTREAVRSQAAAIWLYKIRILEKTGNLREALAWVCLECFVDPSNIAAQAVRNDLSLQMEPLLAPLPLDKERESTTTVWSDVAGMEELKLLIEEEIILPITHWETYQKYQVHPPNGILLYGPPGCGKTFIARRVADRIGSAFVEVTPSDIASIYVHGTQGKIRTIFDGAKKQAPAVIFFDEIDAMIPKRDHDAGHHYSSETNEFLTQLNECHESKLLVIGATNRPERIDPAALRPGRMDRLVYVPPPDVVSREELFRLYLGGRPVAPTLDYEKLADESEGYSCADIESTVNHAARLAARGEEPITTRNLFEAMEKQKPTIRHGDLESFENFGRAGGK